jgi:hypothetical protein
MVAGDLVGGSRPELFHGNLRFDDARGSDTMPSRGRRFRASHQAEGDAMKFPTRLFAAVAMLAVGLCAAAQADVLDQVPPDAMAVLKINSLSAVNAKAVKLANQWGLDEMVPEFKDPLGSVLDKLHMTAGVNKDGDMACAIFAPPPAAAGANDQAPAPAAGSPGRAPVEPVPAPAKEEPETLTLVPVSDYQAFVGNFKEPNEDGDITGVISPDGSSPLFISHWGDYAAVTMTKSLLEAKPTGFKLHGLAVQEAQSQDFTLIANMEQLRTVALPKLQQARAQILDELTKNVPPDEKSQKLVPVLRAVVDAYLNAAQQFMEQGTNGVLSLNLTADGISAGGLAEFKAGSTLGQNLAKLRGTSTTPLLAGLPADRKYFFFGGYAADPKVARQMLGNLVDPIAAQLAAAGDDWKPVLDLVNEVKDVIGATNSTTIGYVVPTGAIGQESILQTVGVMDGDSKAIQAANRKMMTTLSDFIKNGPESKDAPMAIDFKQDAKTVDGISFDHLQSNLAMDPNDPKAAQAQQAIAMIYGPNGMSQDMGAVSDSKFVAVQGGSDELLSDVISSAKAGEDHLSSDPGVAAVTTHLPPNPLGVYYIALDNIVTSAAKYAASFGLPIKLQLPPNLPPIGVGVATDGPSVRIEGFIPADLVQNLISAALQARQNMQAGGAPGAGPN